MKLWKWWQAHRTWVLGTATGVIGGTLGIEGLIAKDNEKWWLWVLMVIGVLTAQGGISSVKSIRNQQQGTTT